MRPCFDYTQVLLDPRGEILAGGGREEDSSGQWKEGSSAHGILRDRCYELTEATVMIERLARALELIDDVPEDVQEQLAGEIEEYIKLPRQDASRIRRLAGIWSDLPDGMEETLLCWRREGSPTPPIEDQLRWQEEE